MNGIILILFIIIFVYLYIKMIKKVKITAFHVSNLFMILIIGIFIVIIAVFPKISYNAASSGINLWFNIVFPSLLPFFVCSELLLGLGFVNFLGALLEPFMRKVFNAPGSGAFSVAMGFTSGYPTGAKIVANLRQKKLCSKTEGERLLSFTNNSGPLFILGAVAVGMFNNPQIGIILISSHYLAALTVGILFRFYKRYNSVKNTYNHCENIFIKAFRELFKARKNDGRSIGMLFGDSIKNSMNILFIVGGFIIFFSVVISLLSELGIISRISSVLSIFLVPLGIDKQLINSVLCGFFEITTGCKYAADSNVLLLYKLITTSIVLGWSGISVHLQVISIISKTDLSPIPYLFAKLIQSITSGIYTYFIFKYISIFTTITVFGTEKIQSSSWVHYFVSSSEILAGILLLLATMSIIFLLVDLITIKKTTKNNL